MLNLRVIALTFVLFVCSVIAASVEADGQSKKETKDFLIGKVDKTKCVCSSGIVHHYRLRFTGDTMVAEFTYYGLGMFGHTYIYTVKLKDLDPSRVELKRFDVDGYVRGAVILWTTDDKKVVDTTGRYMDSRQQIRPVKRKDYGLDFNLSNERDAGQVQRALVHLIRLCDGKIAYPSSNALSESELWRRARLVCGSNASEKSLGVFVALIVIQSLEQAFIANNETVTEREYYAVARYATRTAFDRGGWAYGESINAITSDAYKKAASEQWKSYEKNLNAAAFTIRRWSTQDRKRALQEAKMDHLIAELYRFRRYGLSSQNSVADLIRKHPRYVSKSSQGFKVGDKVANKGKLRIWSGTVTRVSGSRYTVRIDYYDRDLDFGKRNFRRSEEYHFAKSELEHRTHVSPLEVLHKFTEPRWVTR